MRLAALVHEQNPFALELYRRHVLRELETLGVECRAFSEGRLAPADCDLIWDPGMGMRRVPELLRTSRVPVVGTVHGLRAFSMPWREVSRSWIERARLHRLKMQISRSWRWLGQRVARVITVSRYGAEEAARALGLPENLIHPVYHGVAHETFRPEGERKSIEGGYFLVVAQYQAKKNVERILAAYAALPGDGRPALVAVIPGLPKRLAIPDGVRPLREALPPEELAVWYRGAIGFVFPSLHETFGLPIPEAMACGCPVITSDVTACPEVAGEAALVVNPRSTEDIAAAMLRLARDADLRRELRRKGLERARQFTWRRSGEEHLEVFEAAVSQGRPGEERAFERALEGER